MKKIDIMLPLACSISILLGLTASAHAQELEQPLRVEPVMSIKHSEPGLEVWYKIGRFHQQNKRFDLAVQAYRQVLDHEPGNVDARNALASVYSLQNRFDEAVAEYETLLQANPKLSYVYNNLGYAYYLKADYLNAASAFGNAIALEPRNRRAFGNLVQAYEHIGDTESTPTQAEQKKTESGASVTTASVAGAATANATSQTDAAPLALNGIVLEIANGTPDAKLGEYLANALREEGATVTRVTEMKPATQRRNVIQYRDGFYKQALALSRSFTNPPALVNYTNSSTSFVKPNVRLVLGKEALQSPSAAGKSE
jgi:Flp pilus assembly protein TadD